MTIPLYLAVAQWVLLFALAALVTVMYRQLGWHLNAVKPHPEVGPAAGSRAADIEYTRISDQTSQRFFSGDGHTALVAFVDPMCPSCEELVASLNEAEAAGEFAAVRVLLLTSDPPSYLQISEPFRRTRLEVGRVLTDATFEDYRATATPLLVAVDGSGVVRAAGPVTRIEEVRLFARSGLLPTPDELFPLSAVGVREDQHTPH